MLSRLQGGLSAKPVRVLARQKASAATNSAWGGEDNAWVRKVSLLGRIGVTKRTDQIAWHLYHPDSGATGGKPWRGNGHYARNVELLARIERIRTPEEFLVQFPHREFAAPPWPAEVCIGFVTVRDRCSGGTQALAGVWAQALNRAYGASTPLVETEAATLAGTLANLHADAFVVFAEDAAACADLASVEPLRPTVLVLGATEMCPTWPSASAASAWLLAQTQKDVTDWRRLGLTVWHRAWEESSVDMPDSVPVLVQPLSHLLNAWPFVSAAIETPPASVMSEIPVWTYWEGPSPEWIARCLETAQRHAPSIRILGPDDFNALWDRDRDIDLSNLHVAQRADFVRAFLLARFGGLWIDADCIVMRDLAPLLRQLQQFEVIAHRERQGNFSNAFLAAQPDSAVAARFYKGVCEVLRARCPLNWTSIGNQLLTKVLESASEPVLELLPEEVQPICWSQPKAFFRLCDDAGHARELNREAWCYMLSQQSFLRHQKSEPGAALTNERSFFSFLLRQSLSADRPPATEGGPTRSAEEFGVSHRHVVPQALKAAFEHLYAAHRAYGCESISGPGSSLRQTQEIRRRLPLLLQFLNVKTLLDAGCGDFHWMAKVRLGVERYIGVDLLEDLIQRNIETYAAPGRSFSVSNILEDRLPKADIIICRDCLGHLSNEDILRALTNFVDSGSGYLLTTSFPERLRNTDIVAGQWRPLNLQAAPFLLPEPLLILTERCSESNGAFKDKSLALWRLADVQEACAGRGVDKSHGDPSNEAPGYVSRAMLTHQKGRTCRVLIGICSSQSTSKRRRAAHETWMKALPDGVSAIFFVGHGAAIDAPDVVTVSAPDNYSGLVLKVRAFLRHVVEHY